MRPIDADRLALHLNDFALQEAPMREEDSKDAYEAIEQCIQGIEEAPTLEVLVKEKRPVMFAERVAPFCPCCRSGEYMTNEDGNVNEYCGQCGTHLDWEHWEDEDTEEIMDRKSTTKTRCKQCKFFKAAAVTKGAPVGDCTKNMRGNPRYASHIACKKFESNLKDMWGIG